MGRPTWVAITLSPLSLPSPEILPMESAIYMFVASNLVHVDVYNYAHRHRERRSERVGRNQWLRTS